MAFVRILKLCSYLCEQHVLLAYRHFFFSNGSYCFRKLYSLSDYPIKNIEHAIVLQFYIHFLMKFSF